MTIPRTVPLSVRFIVAMLLVGLVPPTLGAGSGMPSESTGVRSIGAGSADEHSNDPETERPTYAIRGTVTYADRVPALRPVSMASDPECAAKRSTPARNPMLVLGEDNALANVLVLVADPPDGPHPVPSEPAVLSLDRCMFEPHVLAVRKNQPLVFCNTDALLHAIRAVPGSSREFHIGMPPTLERKERVFTVPEPPFAIRCSEHAWESAWVSVFDHPYFAVTSLDGKFTIPGLPAGTWTVVAWHEKLGTRTVEVTIDAAPARADFAFRVPRPSRAQPAKD